MGATNEPASGPRQPSIGGTSVSNAETLQTGCVLVGDEVKIVINAEALMR
jgi:hypothetical protein